MRKPAIHPESGFTLVELTIVVVISTIALIAIYQTLITQERTYRYQSAAIDTQGSTRVGLQLLAAELREVSANAGIAKGGSDLLVADRDSIRFRSFRKVGFVCRRDMLTGSIDIWVLGARFAVGDSLALFVEGDTLTDDDDKWFMNSAVLAVGNASNEEQCRQEWPTYGRQRVLGLLPLTVDSMRRGALVRSYNSLTYGAYQWDGEWVLGRRETDGEVVPLVGPILPPAEGGIAFRYFDQLDQVLTPTTAALRSRVARVEITVRAVSRAGLNHQNYVDSLRTNVYLRGN